MTPVIIEQNKMSANKKSWTAQEDQILIQLVIENGDDGKWSHIAKKMDINRSGKQCRERYHNHLKPEIKKGNWTKEEDALILELSNKIGNQWARISKFLPGRSDNAIKNRFHAILNKKNCDSEFDEIYLMHEISHSKLSTLLKPEVLQEISKASDDACININISNDQLKIDLNFLFHNHGEHEHEYCAIEERYEYITTPSVIVSSNGEEESRSSSFASLKTKSSSSEIHDKMAERQNLSFSPTTRSATFPTSFVEGPNSNSSMEWETVGYETNSMAYDSLFNSPIEIMKTCEESWMDDLIKLVDGTSNDKEILNLSISSGLLPVKEEKEDNQDEDTNDINQDYDNDIVDKYALKLKKLSYHSPRSPAHPLLKKIKSTYPINTSVKRHSPVFNNV